MYSQIHQTPCISTLAHMILWRIVVKILHHTNDTFRALQKHRCSLLLVQNIKNHGRTNRWSHIVVMHLKRLQGFHLVVNYVPCFPHSWMVFRRICIQAVWLLFQCGLSKWNGMVGREYVRITPLYFERVFSISVSNRFPKVPKNWCLTKFLANHILYLLAVILAHAWAYSLTHHSHSSIHFITSVHFSLSLSGSTPTFPAVNVL